MLEQMYPFRTQLPQAWRGFAASVSQCSRRVRHSTQPTEAVEVASRVLPDSAGVWSVDMVMGDGCLAEGRRCLLMARATGWLPRMGLGNSSCARPVRSATTSRYFYRVATILSGPTTPEVASLDVPSLSSGFVDQRYLNGYEVPSEPQTKSMLIVILTLGRSL